MECDWNNRIEVLKKQAQEWNLREQEYQKRIAVLEAKTQSSALEPHRAQVNVSNPSGCLHLDYKTRMCDSWLDVRQCAYGNRCVFAHGPHELGCAAHDPKRSSNVQRWYDLKNRCKMSQDSRWKARLCPHHARGTCWCSEEKCRWAHGDSDVHCMSWLRFKECFQEGCQRRHVHWTELSQFKEKNETVEEQPDCW